ncbi:hypothetical protein [Planctomicrobium sp. SH664]|uniref:hypothetical protein n=1 Tax=Planctomicrobium sp. SH664 TaxID=3448125 RepID=UPI003F5C93AD
MFQIWKRCGLPAACFSLLAGYAMADTVVLINGDRVQGDVLGVNKQQLQLRSELLGELAIPRSKVHSIYFGEGGPLPATAQPQTSVPKTGDAPPSATTPEQLLEKLTGKALSPSAADRDGNRQLLESLQQQGLNPQALKEVEQSFPLLAVPEVSEHFQKNLGGLMSGKLDLQDLRKQAIEARDLLNDLKQDLGPEAAALSGYFSILDKFINETAPADEPSASTPAEK